MATQGVKRKLTAILSADVEGYSRLMEEDEAATVETLTAYRETITSLIQQHRGRVVDSPGDNLLAEFASVVDAVQCAVETQELLKAKNAELPEDRRMKFRMGINLGDVIEEGDRIYGDGVNIASRIEALAESGGICISRSVYNQIKKKLVLDYEDLGEHNVKNISEPIGVYRVPLERKAAAVKVAAVKKAKISRRQWTALASVVVIIIVAGALVIQYYVSRPTPIEPASEKKMAYPLPIKPSLAVLPFANMSDDSELEYLSDGFTDTIIGGLSRIPSIFVISRTSTFTYKKKPVTIKQVAEELGVQYIIEGSIQKSGDQLRITAQMIDALTGYHVWSESYDRNIKDIFKMQDEITLNIAKSVGMKFEKFPSTIPGVAGTNNLDAYLKSLRAIYYLYTAGSEGRLKAKQLVKEAIALDPNYLNAYNGLSEIYVNEARWGISKFPEKSLEQALKMAQKAVELDESNSYAHSSLGRVLYNLREHDKAIAELEQAISLDPENAWAYVLVGWTLNWAGRSQEAVPYFKKYMRLDPLNLTTGLFGLAGANLLTGKYEDAIPYIQKAIEMDHPSTWFRYHLDLAACYEALGREMEAKAESQEVLRLSPKFSLKKYIVMLPAKDPEFIKPYVEALRKTGLPE